MKRIHDIPVKAHDDNPFADNDADLRRTDTIVDDPFMDPMSERVSLSRGRGLKLGAGFMRASEMFTKVAGKPKESLNKATQDEDNPFMDEVPYVDPINDPNNPFAGGTPEQEMRWASQAESARKYAAENAARAEFRQEADVLIARMDNVRQRIEREAATSLAERLGVTEEQREEVAAVLRTNPLDTTRIAELVPRVREAAMEYSGLYTRYGAAIEKRKNILPDEPTYSW
jgi:hypothetical protein